MGPAHGNGSDPGRSRSVAIVGGGVKLFADLGSDDVKLESMRVVESPAVTHLKYRVVK